MRPPDERDSSPCYLATLQLGLCVDDDDLTRPGRVALTPTIEQTALVKVLPAVARGCSEGV